MKMFLFVRTVKIINGFQYMASSGFCSQTNIILHSSKQGQSTIRPSSQGKSVLVTGDLHEQFAILKCIFLMTVQALWSKSSFAIGLSAAITVVQLRLTRSVKK